MPYFALLLLLFNFSFFPKQAVSQNMIQHSQHALLFDSALKSASIKLISWNILAGCRQILKKIPVGVFCSSKQSDASFKSLVQKQDLILIQEAYLDKEALQLFSDLGKEYSWDMAVSFMAHKAQQIPTGVLTLSKAKSLTAEFQKNYEGLLPTPKTILYTLYNLSDNNNIIIENKLLVVNIHGILISRASLYAQLETMVDKMARHKGPIMLAGDFNTMTSATYSKLKTIVERIGLTEVKIPKDLDKRVISFTGQYYDIIFSKQLKVINSYAIDLKETEHGKVSDHYPVFAEFQYINH